MAAKAYPLFRFSRGRFTFLAKAFSMGGKGRRGSLHPKLYTNNIPSRKKKVTNGDRIEVNGRRHDEIEKKEREGGCDGKLVTSGVILCYILKFEQ